MKIQIAGTETQIEVLVGDVFRTPTPQDALLLPFHPLGDWSSPHDEKLYQGSAGRRVEEPLLGHARGKSSLFHDQLVTALAAAAFLRKPDVWSHSGETYQTFGTESIDYGNFRDVVFMLDWVFAPWRSRHEVIIPLENVLEFALSTIMLQPEFHRVAFPLFRSELVPLMPNWQEHWSDNFTMHGLMVSQSQALLAVAKKHPQREISWTLVLDQFSAARLEDWETELASLLQ